jgi:hypothetical protein
VTAVISRGTSDGTATMLEMLSEMPPTIHRSQS